MPAPERRQQAERGRRRVMLRVRNDKGVPELLPIDNFERLTENILDELVSCNGLMALGLDDRTLRELAKQVAVNIDYAFNVTWSPNWVKSGEPHVWSETSSTGVTHFAECLLCGAVMAEPTREAAQAAYRDHLAGPHGASV
jgi:hypothetical protein